MARPKSSTPVRLIRKRLADGSVATYYYDRATGAALGQDLAEALRRATPVQQQPGRRRAGTLGALITEYKASPAYRTKAASTRAMYLVILDRLDGLFGDFALSALTPGRILRLRDSMQDEPHKANHTVSILRLVLRQAVQRGYISHNPADKLGRIPTQPRTQIWPVEERARIFEGLRPGVRLGAMLMAYTLQRLSDVLAMTTAQISERDGRMWITLRQSKTAELVDVPVHQDLVPLLRQRLAGKATGSILLVCSPTGLPWARRNFSRAWDHDQRLANLRLARELFRQGWKKDRVRDELARRHRQRRDLRRTGVVSLAEAGASVAQIAAIAGWKIDYAQLIVDTYLPRRTEVALSGIEAWERHAATPAGAVVRIADFRRT